LKGRKKEKMNMMNRRFCLPAIVSAAHYFVVLPAYAPGAYPQGQEAVSLSSAQELPFSDGLVAGNAPSFAGQQGTDVMGKLEGGIGDQMRAALETIKKVVTRAAFSVKDGRENRAGNCR
jgi:enamine deaminase RidA (YjgF/YER057c/UK114 family)